VLVVLDQKPELGHQAGAVLQPPQAVGLEHTVDGRFVFGCLHQYPASALLLHAFRGDIQRLADVRQDLSSSLVPKKCSLALGRSM
jgi:hypothetical protein